jgi:hypothetical protein
LGRLTAEGRFAKTTFHLLAFPHKQRRKGHFLHFAASFVAVSALMLTALLISTALNANKKARRANARIRSSDYTAKRLSCSELRTVQERENKNAPRQS